jgi:hypothetical protein
MPPDSVTHAECGTGCAVSKILAASGDLPASAECIPCFAFHLVAPRGATACSSCMTMANVSLFLQGFPGYADVGVVGSEYTECGE